MVMSNINIIIDNLIYYKHYGRPLCVQADFLCVIDSLVGGIYQFYTV